MTKIEIKSYISNFIPEFGEFSTVEGKEFLPIEHPFAHTAAKKILENNDYGYLHGYIQINVNNKRILSEKNDTEELLETWCDLTYIIRTQAIEKSYDIVLLDNWDKFLLVKREHRYQFILKEIGFEEENEIKSDYFTKEELFPPLLKAFSQFMEFCQKELTFSHETVYESLLKDYQAFQRMGLITD